MYCTSESSSSTSSDDEGHHAVVQRHCEADSIVFLATERSAARSNLAHTAVGGGSGGVVSLPPLTLKETVHEGVLLPTQEEAINSSKNNTITSDRGGAGKPISARGSPRTADVSHQHHDALAATKRRLVVRNATAAPSRCAEEQIVLQRFGEHMTRIPTPPVVREPLHTTNSKEEKHMRNKMRIFGSTENMARVVAGGTSTTEKPSHTTVLCDVPAGVQPQSARGHLSSSPRRGVSRGSDRQHLASSSSPRTCSPRQDSSSNSLRLLNMPHEPNHKLAFADVMFLERQQLAQYLHTDAFPSANNASAQQGGGGSAHRLPMSRGGGGGENNFFLVSRASHRDRVLASSMSARMQPPPSAGGADCPPSPRTPATARGTAPASRGSGSAAGGSARRPSVANNVLSLTEPEELIVEDTSYVVRETRKFERGSLAAAKKNWLSTQANLSADLSAARAESHTSDLLKMIFNARIALECEVASTLRQLADDEGTDKLIADAVNTGQRLALRSANVNDFHHFLCNLLRDTTISFSETRVIFNAIDSNHSGVIDNVELSEGLRLLLLDESQLVLTYGKKVFTEVGRHKDTKLSFLEVQAIFFAALDFFEVEFDPTEVVNAAQIEPKSTAASGGGGATNGSTDPAGGDGASLCAVPSVNFQQQAKLITRRDKSNSPKMTKRNTLATASTEGSGPQPETVARKDSVVFKSTTSLGQEPSSVLESPVTSKPTIDDMKKRMVRECAVVLRESWKYSQGGQIVVPLLRSIALSVAPLLHHAIGRLPIHHFNLKRSGFWKETLAAEDAKYQVYLAQQNLDLDFPLSPPNRLLSFGGGLLSSRNQQRQAKLLQPKASAPPHTAQQQGKRGQRPSGAGGDIELFSEFIDVHKNGASLQNSKRSGSFSGSALPPNQLLSLTRRHSRDGHSGGSQQHQAPSLNALHPISYEEYEEASGEAINVAALQAQLKDGSLRLTHAQRNLIVEQIEQGKAARQAAAAANLRGGGERGHGRKSISGFANKSSLGGPHPGKRKDVAPPSRGTTRLVTETTVSGGPEEDETRNETLMQEALQRKKSESRGSMRGGPQSASAFAIDLNEVIDPWHPRFQADRDKVQSIARQLGSAPEHSHNVYFSKQGHVFSKTPSGMVVPVTGNETSSS